MSASYPGSAKVFTSRSAGQSIASAHINDLQDEVNAIESGLLGGTAPLTSSNATIANLTVAGGSTLATLSVSGGSTFAGVVTYGNAWRVPIQALTLTGGSTTFANIAVASSAAIVQVENNSTAITISGITGGVHGRTLQLTNCSSAGTGMVLLHFNAGSSVDCRFVTGGLASKPIPQGGTVSLYYSTFASLGIATGAWYVGST